jgi:hypothetical protein
MGIYRSYLSQDNWITNRIVDSIAQTGSNHGADPVLTVFAVKSNTSGAFELARSLIKFSLTELSGKVFSDRIIPSASVSYFLKMFDMKHGETIPTSYDLFVYPLSSSWDEGTGVEMYGIDKGYANWEKATSTRYWAITGSDFFTSSYGSGSQHFDRGQENLEVDITSIVNAWLTGGLVNNGLIIKLGSAEEYNATDYYVKEFHGRESKFVEYLPHLEARWSSVKKDNRNNFAYNQNNNLYFYNFIRGQLANATEPVLVRVQDFTGSSGSGNFITTITASLVETGIYSASFTIVNTASFSATFYDIWHSGAFAYMTGNFRPQNLTGSTADQYYDFTANINNLRQVYDSSEEARFKVNVRKKNFRTHATVLKSASLDMDREYIESMYYSIINDETGFIVVPFGTGSANPYTKLSYNSEGNYFDLFFNCFVPGFKYRIKLLIQNNKDKKILDDDWIFKVT